MPRSARIVVPDIPHHITQRGNRGYDVFFDDADRETYLGILRDQVQRHELKVHGWCLMSNHIHLIATPPREDSLARAVGRTHHLYSMAFNRKHEILGHVWHSRYYSCPIDTGYLITAMIYVDQNPVRAGLVEYPWDWKWSSASAHINMVDPWELVDMDWWQWFSEATSWKELIAALQMEKDVDRLRKHTNSGRPLGSEKFVKSIGQKLGYPVTLKPRGRPRKTES
jgi:putative transposase